MPAYTGNHHAVISHAGGGHLHYFGGLVHFGLAVIVEGEAVLGCRRATLPLVDIQIDTILTRVK